MTARTIELGGRIVNTQIEETGLGSATMTFTAGENTPGLYLGELKTTVDSYSHKLTRNGHRVLVRQNDRAIQMQIGDIRTVQLENFARELPNDLLRAWNRKPMAHTATNAS